MTRLCRVARWRTAVGRSGLAWAVLAWAVLAFVLIIPARVAFVQAAAPLAQAADANAAAASPQRALVDRYCVGCHNQRAKVAGLMLDTADVTNVGAAPAIWEKVAQKLRGRAMPPIGLPRPDAATYDSLAGWLETELDRAAAAHPNPGRPGIHRLNRSEYANAIRDLLSLDVDTQALLPPDDVGFGFDNNADVLTVSSALMDRYLSAARKIGRLAVGDRSMRPVEETYRISPLLVQEERVSEDLPFGSRGGIAIRHYFPLDGEYRLKIYLQKRTAGANGIRGFGADPQKVDVRLDGARVAVLSVGDASSARAAEAAPGGNTESQMDSNADVPMEVTVAAKAGRHVLGVSLLKKPPEVEGTGPTRLPVWTFGSDPGSERIGIDSVRIEGPYKAAGPGETASRARIFSCRPSTPKDEDACAKVILASLARRAYRRPSTDADVRTLMGFYRTAQSTGGFDSGIQAALERILFDPEFLFRSVRDPGGAAAGGAYRLSDLELASRLSFFLWSSIPDDELLDVAARGRLKGPVVLEAQVRRMLADRRSTALVTNFAAQWLHLRNMRAVTPNVNVFPEFDDNLRQAFVWETELFFESQLRDDRNVDELLTANYTFVNERLAKHYGIPGVRGNRFRRVTFGDDKRAGLLGQGSILTVTSYATRTSPVVRGKWLLETVLGAPPPPPPPNVPALQENGAGVKATSIRARMEQHRKNPVCATCHARMDPLGFALENYDGIGRWRDADEGGLPIDASGTMPDGAAFTGPADLRRLLQARRDEFVRNVTSKLLMYAVGREVEFYDMPAVRGIMGDAAAHDYRWSSIVLGIVKSRPFQMRKSES